ncbi:MAG: rhodanese-like domain-containing protein [Sandaracinaceae bacterium]
MSAETGTTADALAEDRATVIVDIRPTDERRTELGYVPGSYPVPFTGDAEADADALLAFNDQRAQVALVCVSGRRSSEALSSLAPHYPLPLTHLERGILGWGEAGLPLCGVEEPAEEEAPSLDAIKQQIRSCFVAEAVETSLDAEADLDPMAALQACLDAEGVTLDEASPEELYRVIDRMALVSRNLGAAHSKIAANVDRMTAMLDHLEE